ncbi:MAG TPA: lysylphosphatidylglycerol synthase transmembrane domain-containing protein [Phycisphaerae bacterium]|nr:lysylphosphatidylglycerol synthase transmembrane domain-containing protein [Phycisphaerae bacterium]
MPTLETHPPVVLPSVTPAPPRSTARDEVAPAIDTPARPGRLGWLRAVLPIVLLGIVLFYTDWQNMLAHAREANQPLLWSAFILYQLVVLLQGWRWQIVARSDGGDWPLWRMQYINYISMFFDSFTPGKLGSDAYRMAAMHRNGRVHHLLMSLLALRMHGMAASIVLAGVTGAIVLSFKHGWEKVGLPAALFAIMLIFVGPRLYRALRVRNLQVRYSKNRWAQAFAWQVKKTHDAIVEMFAQRQTRRWSNWLVLIYLLGMVTVYWLVGQAFGMTLPYSSYLAGVPVLILASVLPISIQGRGLTEVIAIGLWQGRRASQEQILLACLTVFAIMVLQGLIGGLIWAAGRGKEIAAPRRTAPS